MSKNCSGCRIGKDKEGTAEYDHFSVDHKCSANFEGSADAMEAAGVLQCF